MVTYSTSNIVAYSSHLPTKVVTLPLKYLPCPPVSDVSEKFKKGCLNHGELVDLSSQKGCFFPTLQVGFTNDMRSVWLSPLLVDETTLLGLQFQNLKIQLPHLIISNRTMTCQFVANNSNGEPYVLIDVIDQSYLFLTLRIELSDFIMGNSTNRLSKDNFTEWVNISVPYSFELRSEPFCVKALDASNIIISLKDGGLLHFKRHHPLGPLDVFDFAESTPLMSLNLVSLLFKGTGTGEVLLNGISLNASVDMVKLTESEFVSLSTTKQVTFWNIETHKQSRPKIDMCGTPDQIAWLNNVPNRYLAVTHCDNETRLSLLLPQSSKLETSSHPAFEMFNWVVGDEHLSKTSSFAIDESTETTSERTQNSTMMIQDFRIQNTTSHLKFVILWKCNTFASVVSYEVNKESFHIDKISRSHAPSASPFEELIATRSDSEIADAIFKSGNYDENIVLTALEVFEYNLNSIVVPEDTSLRKHLTSTIKKISKSQGVTVHSLWYKFALLCDEFKKASQEVLALLPTPDYILTLQVNGLGIFRIAHLYEAYHLCPSGDLSALLAAVTSKFSLRVFRELTSEIRNCKSVTAENATQYATSYLSSKISDEETQEIMESLSSIPGALEEILLLVNVTNDIALFSDDSTEPSSGEGCGLLSKILTIDIFKSVKKSHELILINLFVLLLLCEVNDTILDLQNKIVAKLKYYSLMSDVFDLAFKDSSSNSAIEVDSVSRYENSIFWQCAARRHAQLQDLIMRKDYNAAFDFYCVVVLTKQRQTYLLDLFLELLNRNQVKIILDELKKSIDCTTPVVHFLFGIVYLFNNQYDDFYESLSAYQTFSEINSDEVHAKLVDRLGNQKVIKNFLMAVFAPQELELLVKSNYFHQASQLCMSYYDSIKTRSDLGGLNNKTSLLRKSVSFEKMAIETLSLDDDQNRHAALTVTYLRNLFNDAVEIKLYDEAIRALDDISSMVSSSEMSMLLSRIIRALLNNKRIDSVFSKGTNNLFKKNYLLVDSILLEIANGDLILSNALQCYEYLYLWRLLGGTNDDKLSTFRDIRGAAEALYIFITRFKLEKDSLMSESTEIDDYKQFKLRILELYKIIINCLKTFKENDDRWILRRDPSNKTVVATVDELTIEYYKWLKELECDLS